MPTRSAWRAVVFEPSEPSREPPAWPLPARARAATALPSRIVSPDAPLEHPAWAWLALAAGLAIGGWALWSRAQHRAAPTVWRVDRFGAPPRLFLKTRTALTVLLLAVAALLGANTYTGYVPSVSALASLLPFGSSVAHVERIEVPSTAPGTGGRSAYVYLPPGYGRSRRRYPVLYLIHGNPGQAIDYFRAGLAADAEDTLLKRGAGAPVILVAVQASRSFTHDSECLDEVGGAQEETYLTRTVVPYVDTHYRTEAERSSRGIAGFSSGAFCALNLALRHQDEFSLAAGEQPYADPGGDAERADLRGDARRYAANSPDRYLPTLAFRHPVAVYMDAPAGDETVGQGKVLLGLLRARGQRAELHVLPAGHHSWLGVQEGFPAVLAWAARELRP